MWVNQNFLLQEDVNAEADGINLAFVSLRGSGPFHFRMDNSGQVNIVLTLNAPMPTKVVCFSRLLKYLRCLYGK